jgi:glycosyltransferase involved in cell wall biosynthesis
MDEKVIKSSLMCKFCGTILDEACIKCNLCGTEAGKGDTIGFEGDFEPDNNLMECIYGPPPCDYNFVCRSCEHSWTEYLMLVNETKRRQLKNIRFLDQVPKKDVFEYIIASDLGISVLKRVDTFKTIYSNKTFDYMSCKKPVLLAIDGVSRTLIEEADCGIFYEPEHPIDIANKIKIYLKNPELIRIHGNNGYEFAKKNFDRNILALEYINLIREILGNK